MAPAFCFPLTEFCMYALFICCLVHAIRQNLWHVTYLLGGVLFGLILEYVNVNANMGYVYGQFTVMLGRAPLNIPLCIGIGWGVIMYSARLFTDSYGLPLWTSAAMDALLAISIDLSMDAVAYRLHMWHWNWSGSGLNPLRADWFGVPYGNFFGWLMVVFFYSSFFRTLQRAFMQRAGWQVAKALAVPLMAVLLSQVALYGMLVYVDKFLLDQFGVTSLMRFAAFLSILFLVVVTGWSSRKANGFSGTPPLVTWLVPVWFHAYFFLWLFAGGFYIENPWLIAVSCLNIIFGLTVHTVFLRAKSADELHLTALQ